MQEKEKPELVRLETPAQWLIWRFNMRGHFCPMSENQAMLLKLLQAGKTFSEICGDFTSIMPEDEIVNFVAGTIRSWVDEGIFSAYQISAA
ncbi:MAG: hypothetical protein K0Q74_1343 [Gammaproteobacteria bacterium]|nr:hypothetical protein [Gammaproteobacteria bacterium]